MDSTTFHNTLMKELPDVEVGGRILLIEEWVEKVQRALLSGENGFDQVVGLASVVRAELISLGAKSTELLAIPAHKCEYTRSELVVIMKAQVARIVSGYGGNLIPWFAALYAMCVTYASLYGG